MPVLQIIAGIIVTIATYLFLLPRLRSRIKGVPVENGIPLIGTKLSELHAGHVYAWERTKSWGQVIGAYGWNPFRLAGVRVSNPKVVKEMLQSNYEVFDKDRFQVEPFDDVAGGLVFIENGWKWKDSREMFEPFFKHAYMRKQQPMFKREMEKLVSCFERDMAKSPTGFDVQELFHRFTFDTISSLTFGFPPESQLNEGSDLLNAFMLMVNESFMRFVKIALIPVPLSWKRNLVKRSSEYEKAHNLLRKVINEKIEAVREAKTDVAKAAQVAEDISVITTLIRDNTVPDWMDRAELIKQLITLLFAGHDTTSNMLTWTFYFLAHYPDCQQKLRDEALAAFGRDGELDIDTLERSKYCTAFLKESLRLRPSSLGQPRFPSKPVSIEWDDTTTGTKGNKLEVRPGMSVMYDQWAMQRDPNIWGPTVEEFDPERFIKDPHGGATSIYAFVPFSYGPRRCLGEKLALTEGRWILTEIVRRWKVVPADKWDYQIAVVGNMRARYGIGVKIVPLSEE
ncbi:cytochrome P450 [Gonapodya prolifera JEL478]|uniref:Cytochrome P450 n=1 Tax=Gonapodya prolifera (strain JEL478) TaxID=1344416 RepID=A0A139AJH9_GONPJ|nr:cytochrome P450 [Gonapodya prolifera JEL478]|eukprot:KXS16937.1 cytochrome P450 [Gonapodya prolifera JEL478]